MVQHDRRFGGEGECTSMHHVNLCIIHVCLALPGISLRMKRDLSCVHSDVPLANDAAKVSVYVHCSDTLTYIILNNDAAEWLALHLN